MEETGLLDSINTEGGNKQLIIWRVISLILLTSLVTVGVLYALGVGWKEENEEKKDEINPDKILSLWNKNSNIYTKLVPYMNDITDKDSNNFIPMEDRIAVFDLDGTLFCETDPIYFDWNMFRYRILDDDTYDASPEEIELATIIKNTNIHSIPSGLEKEHAIRAAYSYRGMNIKELEDYTKAFLNQDSPGYINLKRKDGFYKPMLQVIEYLKKNDFTVFIVSGTDRFIVRTICKEYINIPESQIIGSSVGINATGQNGRDGLDYQFKQNDSVILGGNFIVKNVKMNKVSAIQTEIGKKPVLSFGNSSGDTSMSNFIVSNNKYKSLAFMVCCDDIERENGNITRADSMKHDCEINNWQPISMRDDWVTIYGENVKRK